MNNRQPWQSTAFQDRDNPRRYEAWEESSAREMRLSIRGKDTYSTIPYGTIIFVEFVPSDLLSLMTVHYIITLKGRKLTELNELLQDEKIRNIQIYDERRFDLPNETAPVVQSAKIEWLKPKPGEERS